MRNLFFTPLTRSWWGGVCIGVGLLAPFTWLLTPLGIAIVTEALLAPGSLRARFARGYSAGLGKFLIVLSWGWHALPLTWLGIESSLTASGIILFFWFLIAGAMAFGIALFGLCAHIFATRYTLWSLIPLWLCAEILSSLLYSLLLLGPGSDINSNFSFGYAGYALAMMPFGSGAARIYGVYGMSLIVAAVAMTALWWWREKRTPWVSILTITLFFSLTSLSVPRYTAEGSIRIAVIDTYFSSHDLRAIGGEDTKQREVRNAVEVALLESPDFVLLPEDSRWIEAVGGIAGAQEFLSGRASSSTVIDSGRTTPPFKNTVLRARFLSAATATPPHIDKHYLTPLGEFIPSFVSALFRVFPDAPWKIRIAQHLSYRPSEEETLHDSPAFPTVLFCMEKVSPFGAQGALARHSGPFIAHPVSMSWFADTTLLDTQLRAMLRVHAIWTQTPIVVAGNEYDGYIVLPDGTFVVPTEVVGQGDSYTVRMVSL